MNVTEITKFVIKNKKPILIAAGVIVAVVVVWIVAKRVKRSNQVNEQADIQNFTGQQVSPGINFNDLAKRMFMAWISTVGTDENEVYSILEQMNNQADWEYLKARYAAYWNDMSVFEQLTHTIAGLGLTGTLVSDMRRELNKRELQRCRTILEDKHIVPGF